MDAFGLTRDQLCMVVYLESFHAGMHPDRVFRQKWGSVDNHNNKEQPISRRLYNFATSSRRAHGGDTEFVGTGVCRGERMKPPV